MQQLILESRLRIESHKISGIALIPRISRNQNLYLPEELKRADGKTVPLNWEHQTEKRAIGQVTFHYDSDLQQLRYEGMISDEGAYTLIKNRTHHVSIGAEPASVRSVCGSEKCYNLPEGLNFKELSIVGTPGIPESTLNLIEAYFVDSKLIHENCTKCKKEAIQDKDHEFVGITDKCEVCGEDRTNYKHGKQAIYPDSEKSMIDPPIGYKDDPHKKPHIATEYKLKIELDESALKVINFLLEKVANLEYIVTKETHKFMPHDTYTEKCSICGQHSESAIHADAKINQECTKCGGTKRTETCTKCGGLKKN